MNRIVLLLLLTTSFSCSEKLAPKDYNMEITMEIGQSYKYDLKNKVYTVFGFMNRDTAISFNLSNVEIQEIVDKYYALKLDSLEDRMQISVYDHNPIILHYIKVKSRGVIRHISIEANRENYNSEDVANAKIINEFISFIKSVVKSKPELKNAPESEVGYF